MTGLAGEKRAPLEQRLIDAILDIDAHATGLGEDDDGFVSGGYLISIGSLHRALGVVGHAAPKCQACEARDHDCKAVVNETDEPLDPVQAAIYWQQRLSRAQAAISEFVGVLGDLVDALSDELQHEVSQSPAVIEATREAVQRLGPPYRPYLDAWWLGGDEAAVSGRSSVPDR